MEYIHELCTAQTHRGMFIWYWMTVLTVDALHSWKSSKSNSTSCGTNTKGLQNQ